VAVTILRNSSFCARCLVGLDTNRQLKIYLFAALELGLVAALVVAAV
jgi:hypothetical protein